MVELRDGQSFAIAGLFQDDFADRPLSLADGRLARLYEPVLLKHACGSLAVPGLAVINRAPWSQSSRETAAAPS